MSGRAEGGYELSGRRVLVTGGAGFIGSHLVRRLLEEIDDVEVTTLDALTYAGNLDNLATVAERPRHRFVEGNVCDADVVDELTEDVDVVFHLAAETHVDRSIDQGVAFARTDVVGTAVLLEAARRHGVERFVHVSTDEVYGEVLSGSVQETAPPRPRNPYSATKAGADLLAQAYGITHGLPVVVARPSNMYGPNQYPEKFIPLFTINALEGRPMPLYGDGRQRREWTHVSDGCAALLCLARQGEVGRAYNVSSGEERANAEVAEAICAAADADPELIESVSDRPAHDRRYSVDATALRSLGWAPGVSFDEGLPATVSWYAEHPSWWRPIVESSPAYRRWIERQYGGQRTPPA